MKVAQLGYGVAEGIVYRTFGQLPSMDMRDRNLEGKCGNRGSVRFKPVAKDHQHVRAGSREDLREPRRPPGHGFCNGRGIIRVRQHLHPLGDFEAVLFYGFDRHSEPCGEMHPRYVEP